MMGKICKEIKHCLRVSAGAEKAAPHWRQTVATPLEPGNDMNRDQVEGSLEKAKGKVKETAGKLVGNESLEAEGKVDQVSGAVQKKVGDVKQAIDTVTRKP